MYQWTSTDMVMDRLDGPSMLADLVRRPWRLVRHARTLAELHRRLHAMDREAAARWPWARRLRLGVVRTNDQVLGFWRRMGFTETGEVRPWRYHRLESEVLLMDRPVP